MVQIVQSPSAFNEFLGGITPGVSDALGSYMKRGREEKQLSSENKALQALGHQDLSGVRTPKLREALLESSIKGKEQKEKLTALKGNLATMEKLGFLPEGASQIGDEALAKLLANYEIGQKEAGAAEQRTIGSEKRAEDRTIRTEERGEKIDIRREGRKEKETIREEDRKIKRSQEQAKALKIDERIIDPSVQNTLINVNAQNKKSDADYQKSIEAASVIEKNFGPQAAQLYVQLTEGGKTKFFEQLLMAKLEGQNLEDVLGKFIQQNPEEINRITEQQPSENLEPAKGVQEDEKTKFPEIEPPKNKTPKQLGEYRDQVRKENAPIYQEAGSKLKSLKSEEDHLKILKTLSPKVPNGIGRVFVNPEGQIRPWAQILKLVPPEAERFVKTVNDFITGAKDIFGSRVTNFDLQTFKSRLPTLINTEEGRQQIIQQMGLFNEIERNYQQALKDVYRHYTLEGISQEQAEELAEKITSSREKELRDQLDKVGMPKYDIKELPDPSRFRGKVIEDSSGKRFKSNGTDWEPV